MKIFLAGENGKKRIIPLIHNTTQHNDMKIYLAGGESRHWLNTPLIENNTGNQNANISGGRILPQHGKRSQADCMGGIVPEVNHEAVSGKPSHVAKIQTGNRISNATIEGGYS